MVCLLCIGRERPSFRPRIATMPFGNGSGHERYATARIWRWSSRRRIGRHEEPDAGRIAVQKVIAPHRADLPHREESGDRQRSHLIPDRAGVMVRSPEEPLPSAVATEYEGSRG